MIIIFRCFFLCRNVFSSVIDALDKDPEMKGIKRIVAEVGRSHARRRISKKAFNVMNNITSIVTSNEFTSY